MAVTRMPRAGFYTGTFDPPTRAHTRIIADALRKKGLAHVVVVANQSGSSKVFRCTAEQRVAMVKADLPEDIRDRVTVLAEPGIGKNGLFDQLQREHRYDWYGIIGHDSYRRLHPQLRSSRQWLVVDRDGQSAAGTAANVEHMSIGQTGAGVSSSRARMLLAEERDTHTVLNPGTAKLIAQRGYYVTPDHATALARSAHFCATWNLIAGAQTAIAPPLFVPQQSPEEHESYIRRYLADALRRR